MKKKNEPHRVEVICLDGSGCRFWQSDGGRQDQGRCMADRIKRGNVCFTDTRRDSEEENDDATTEQGGRRRQERKG